MMNKCLHFEREGRGLGVLSITAPETKGFVYIEAHKEAHAKEAVKGMRLIMTWSMKLVPVSERMQVLQITRQKKPIKEGAWVRIRRGMFKGDLGQCVRVTEGGMKAIKLMPRLDLQGMEGVTRRRLAQAVQAALAPPPVLQRHALPAPRHPHPERLAAVKRAIDKLGPRARRGGRQHLHGRGVHGRPARRSERRDHGQRGRAPPSTR